MHFPGVSPEASTLNSAFSSPPYRLTSAKSSSSLIRERSTPSAGKAEGGDEDSEAGASSGDELLGSAGNFGRGVDSSSARGETMPGSIGGDSNLGAAEFGRERSSSGSAGNEGVWVSGGGSAGVDPPASGNRGVHATMCDGVNSTPCRTSTSCTPGDHSDPSC